MRQWTVKTIGNGTARGLRDGRCRSGWLWLQISPMLKMHREHVREGHRTVLDIYRSEMSTDSERALGSFVDLVRGGSCTVGESSEKEKMRRCGSHREQGFRRSSLMWILTGVWSRRAAVKIAGEDEDDRQSDDIAVKRSNFFGHEWQTLDIATVEAVLMIKGDSRLLLFL